MKSKLNQKTVIVIVKLKFVNRTSKNEKNVEKLQMSGFLLHLLINSWTLFYFDIKLHNIEHTFKTLIKANQAKLYINLILLKSKQVHFSPISLSLNCGIKERETLI